MIKFLNTDDTNKDELKKIELKPEQKENADLPIDAYKESLLFKNSIPISIYEKNNLIAFLIYEYLDNEKTEFLIWDFVVDANQQGKGYGKKIMLQLIKYLQSNYKLKKICLAFVPENTIARNLYKKLGFIETGKINDDNEIEMEKLF